MPVVGKQGAAEKLRPSLDAIFEEAKSRERLLDLGVQFRTLRHIAKCFRVFFFKGVFLFFNHAHKQKYNLSQEKQNYTMFESVLFLILQGINYTASKTFKMQILLVLGAFSI